MSESLITERSGAFRSSAGWTLAPLCRAAGGRGRPPQHGRALRVPGGRGGDGCSRGLCWRRVPVPPEQPDSENRHPTGMTINNNNKREYK